MTAYPYRYRRRTSLRGLAGPVAAGALAAALASGVHAHAGPAARHGGTGGITAAASRAIAYARAQVGKPYLWGGTGPDAFDCSGLVMEAYASAGVRIARTSQDQWATEPHIPASRVAPGDLVFFAGADGTMASPGHVGIVTGHGQMIEAYATGYPVRVASYDRPGRVGFTQPQGGS